MQNMERLILTDGIGNKDTIDRNVYLNTKLSIQVVAPKLQERRLYKAMDIINQAIHSEHQDVRSRL